MQVSGSTSCRTSKQQDGQQQTLSTQERTTKDKQTWMLQEFTNGGKEKERTKESQKEKEKALESTAKEKEEKEKVTEKEKASTTKRAKDEEKEEEKEKEKAEDEDTAKAGAEDTTTKEKEKVTTTTTQEPTSVTTARSLGTTKPIADLNRETCRMPGTYRRMMNRACEHKPQQFQAAAPQQQPQEQLQRSLQRNLQYGRSPCTTWETSPRTSLKFLSLTRTKKSWRSSTSGES